MRPALIRHHELEGTSSHGVNEFAMQRASIRFAQRPSGFSQRLNRAANIMGRRLWRQGLTKGHRDGIRQAFRDFPEEPAPIETEDAAPDAGQMDRNDGRGSALHDPFEAPSERQQRARSRNLSL